ncbi:MAG: TonB-dependent receptor [Kofleriaceae bacterium]|nr:TonB-dependent receptor [Kofleriaceae bacterium]
MRAKSVCLAALAGLIGPVATAEAQPGPDDGVAREASGGDSEEASTPADDLLFATGLRPIGKRRLEAIAEAGTTTQTASVRASSTYGGMGFELTGGFDVRDFRTGQLDSDTTSGRYGARITRGNLSAELFGQTSSLHIDSALTGQAVSVPTSTLGARLHARSGRLRTFGIEHELAGGIGYVAASGELDEQDPNDQTHMVAPLRTSRGEHRFLDAYLRDTVRVIESLDVSTGFVIDKWSFLNGTTALRYGIYDEMEVEYPSITDIEFEPQLGALYRIDDTLALAARGTRAMRAPTLGELYRPILEGDAATAANPTLRPESVWSAEVGPQITAGAIEARAYFYRNEIDAPIASVDTAGGTRQRANLGHAAVTGVVTEASWRPAKAWLATVEYTFAASTITDAGAMAPGDVVGKRLALTPRNRVTAILTYDNPRIVTVTGAVRYVGRQFADAENSASLGAYTLVDAMVARKIHGGLAGFVAVENLLDRRYLASAASFDTYGAPRSVHLGLRLDTARF